MQKREKSVEAHSFGRAKYFLIFFKMHFMSDQKIIKFLVKKVSKRKAKAGKS